MAGNIINKIPFYCKYQTGAFKIRYDTKRFYQRVSSTETGNSETLQNKELEMQAQDYCEHDVTVNFSNGQKMIISTGKLANLADGCASVKFDETTVMATAVSKTKTGSQSSFVPLTVSYVTKAAALGRIPLNFRRRETGHSDDEILTSRMIDRSVRPLFPEGFNWDTQIICNPLALNGLNLPDVLAINAASAALAVSDIPWNGPVGAVRLGCIGNSIILNPSKKELAESTLNLVITARTKKLLVMVEAFASNILVTQLLKALKIGIKECQAVVRAIDNLSAECGKSKRTFTLPEVGSDLKEAVDALATSRLRQIFTTYSHNKLSRDQEVSELHQSILEKVKSDFGNGNVGLASEIFHTLCHKVFRDLIFETEKRCDGRSLTDLRNISCEVDLYEPLHGSALFRRGQTQVMCTVALDSPTSALRMDSLSLMSSGLKEKNFFVHYEFPPYATKEVGRQGPLGRREIGHGTLAERALKGNVPENFPFTIRLTSEVMESNGSSSMATVCGGSLALMDAGVPMENACAGIAMGLVTREAPDGEIEDFKVLTDIMGIEDHFGDTDFKIAGTKKAITALQVDVKNSGLPMRIIMELINQSRTGLNEILKKMNSVCSSPRITRKKNWPVMEKLSVPAHLRSKFIGPGGMNVKKMEIQTGVEIIEENIGVFNIFACNQGALDEVKDVINVILKDTTEPVLEFGGVYTAKIVEIKEHGCLVTLHPNMSPALIHISQLDQRKVIHPSALGMEVGQEIQVKYFGRDPVSGMIRLSRKVLQATASEIVKSFIKKDSPEEDSLADEEEEEEKKKKI